MKFKDWCWVAVIIVLGLWSLPACKSAEKHDFPSYRMSGVCWNWDRIEKQAKRKRVICSLSMSKRLGVFCNRVKGHGGYHHQHLEDECRWVW